MFEDKSASELRNISRGSDNDYNGCWEEELYSLYAQEEMERRGYNWIPTFDESIGERRRRNKY